MRNDACALFLILLTFTCAARAVPGSWFPPSPCNSEALQSALLAGDRLVLSVHYQIDVPPHNVVLQRGTDNRWRVPLEEWRQWTPLPPPSDEAPAAERDGKAVLNEGSALAMRLDACTSELWIDANPGRGQVTDMNRPAPRAVARASNGGFVNFDLSYGGLAGRNVMDSLLDIGAFTSAGAARSGFFVGNNDVRRLDTSWIHDEPGDAIRLRVGDSITHSADWETPVRFGGVQWGTDFSLQPDRITFPLPSIAGSAAVPSTAQLYVNGVQQSQQAVPPGQFRFDSVPALTGAGDLTVLIRDSLGREQSVTQPFYASPRLLTAGLDANTFEAGFLRENYAAPDDHYSQAFAAATLQHGFTDTMSGLLRGAAGGHRQLAGAEADYILSTFGVLTLSSAASNTERGLGAVGTIGFERQADDVSFSVRRRTGTRDYGDLGRDPGTLHFSDAARLSVNMHTGGIASLIYISERPWSGNGEAIGSRLAGLAWSGQPTPRVSVYGSWLYALSARSSNSVAVGIAVSLARGTSGGVQWNQGSGAQAATFAIQHSPAERLGWSYSASDDTEEHGLRQVQAALTTERGTIGAGWAGLGSQGSPSIVAQTAIAFLDDHAFWTRPIQSSFAVIDAGDAAGVHVYRENQLVGVTDDRGRLLVPDLLPFTANHLTIEDRDLPIGLGLNSDSEQVAPPANAGVAVHFRVDSRTVVRFHWTDAKGGYVPAGATIRLDGRELALPVGYDGLVYADISEGKHSLEAAWAAGRCRSWLEVSGGQARVDRCARLAP